MNDEGSDRAERLERLLSRPSFGCRCLETHRGACDGCRLNLLAGEVRRLRALLDEREQAIRDHRS